MIGLRKCDFPKSLAGDFRASEMCIAAPAKNKNAFRMESVKIQMYGMSPTGTVSASLRFGLPPAVRMFRTHAQASLLCEFRVLCACAGSLVGRGRPLREQSPLRSDARFADANWLSAATGSPNVPNPCASGFALRISEFSALAPGRLLVGVDPYGNFAPACG